VYENSEVIDSTQLPNLVGKGQNEDGGDNWLNVNGYALPAQGTFGEALVGVARLPRNTQFDSSLQKDFSVP
jgi:hypothetical protein